MYIRPLKIKDSVPKYKVPIQQVLDSWLEDDGLLNAMANAAFQEKRFDSLEKCVRTSSPNCFLLGKLREF
jgi:hypothetical protein